MWSMGDFVQPLDMKRALRLPYAFPFLKFLKKLKIFDPSPTNFNQF